MEAIRGVRLRKFKLRKIVLVVRMHFRHIVKTPKSTHIIPILKSLHWLKVNERIEYKFLSYLQSSYNCST